MARACERHINSRFDHARRQLFGAVVAGAIMLVLLGTPAQAWVEIDVTTTDDVLDAGDGVVSLREAVIEANALAGDDTISVPAGTYTLSIAGTGENAAATGDLDITDNLTITGAGACQTIIDANGIDRVFHVFGGVSADISGVTITGGSVNGTEDGAGILNLGTLTVTDSTITANAAAGHNSGGGGIDNEVDATLMVTGSTISNNVANDGGGGIGNNGDLTVINSTISGNTNPNDGVGDPGSDAGGGIGNFEFGTATIINSTISNNSAAFAGGGLINENVAVEVNVGNTIIAGNTTVGSGPDVGGAFTSG
ncbi:MAG: hypothetical protein IH988_04170, partial [Planctomycetes bacterium]|nr:hypothetical protein [Planctomycetota bacterium]